MPPSRAWGHALRASLARSRGPPDDRDADIGGSRGELEEIVGAQAIIWLSPLAEASARGRPGAGPCESENLPFTDASFDRSRISTLNIVIRPLSANAKRVLRPGGCGDPQNGALTRWSWRCAPSAGSPPAAGRGCALCGKHYRY